MGRLLMPRSDRIRGFEGQRIGGPKITPFVAGAKRFNGPGTWSPGMAGTAFVWMLGAGAGGQVNGNGGGGGAAVYAAIPLLGGELLTATLGGTTAAATDGVDSILQI